MLQKLYVDSICRVSFYAGCGLEDLRAAEIASGERQLADIMKLRRRIAEARYEDVAEQFMW